MTQQEFWKNVNRNGLDDCWEWTRAKFPSGYGHLRYEGKNARAHRVAYEITNGNIPAGMQVCHRCDNPACCNPAHLFLGTPSENALDSVHKGRWGRERARQPKLGKELIAEIRAAYIPGVVTQLMLAKRYGVGDSTICRVLKKTRAYASD